MSSPPDAMTIFLTSLAPWSLSFLGPILIRTELHAWVNVIILTMIYPVSFWLLSKKTFYPDISQGGIMLSVIFSVLFMTLLLEARPDLPIVKKLKKYLKEYGREPFNTFGASMAIVTSLFIGFGISMMIQRERFLELDF